MHRLTWWALVSLILAAILSGGGIYFRYKAEASNKAVGIAVELQTIYDFAAFTNQEVFTVLKKAKGNDINGVVVTEDTVQTMIDRGELHLNTFGSMSKIYGSPQIIARMMRYGTIKFGEDAFRPIQNATDPGIEFVGPIDQLRQTSLGIDEAMTKLARNAGMEIIFRHSNTTGVNQKYIETLFEDDAKAGGRWFLPSGDQMLGRRGNEAYISEALDKFQMFYLTPEFAKLSGDAKIRDKSKERTLRLHAIQPAESDKMTEWAVIERFVKAFRERGIRWLLVRPISMSEEDPLTAFFNLTKRVGVGVRSEGGDVKIPRPFTEPENPQWLAPAIALSTVPFLAWIGFFFFPQKWVRITGIVLLTLLAAACWKESIRPYFDLVAAIGFPTGAYVWLAGQEKINEYLGYLIMILMSLVGGMIVAGTLVGITWSLQNDQFSGIKAAHFVPIGLAGLILMLRQGDIKTKLKSPIFWGTAALSLAILAAVAFMLSRTGNDNPAGVSDSELAFRALLDKILIVRPRTKEFLIGHPALILGLGLLSLSIDRRKLFGSAAILLTIGAIGLTSVVNTLCHLHSPVDLAFIRIGIGAVLGGIIGFGIWGVLRVYLIRTIPEGS